MDIKDAIFTRRTVRKYTGKLINNSDLELILKAGFLAPSAHNFQPRNFIVIKDRSTIKNISRSLTYAKMLPSAGCGIVVCGDKNVQEEIGFLVEDCSASIENMLLMARGIGLGSVWCGLYPIEEYEKVIRDILNLPENIIPVGMVVVGYPDEKQEYIERYNKNKVHYENWGNI